MKKVLKNTGLTLVLFTSLAFFYTSKNYGQCYPKVTQGYWDPNLRAFVCLGSGDITCIVPCSAKVE